MAGNHGLGALIRAKLDEMGWSVKRLSDEMAARGCTTTRGAVHHWIDGRTTPSAARRVRLVDALGLTGTERAYWLARMADRS